MIVLICRAISREGAHHTCPFLVRVQSNAFLSKDECSISVNRRTGRWARTCNLQIRATSEQIPGFQFALHLFLGSQKLSAGVA
jgi:hypothetical protein